MTEAMIFRVSLALLVRKIGANPSPGGPLGRGSAKGGLQR